MIKKLQKKKKDKRKGVGWAGLELPIETRKFCVHLYRFLSFSIRRFQPEESQYSLLSSLILLPPPKQDSQSRRLALPLAFLGEGGPFEITTGLAGLTGLAELAGLMGVMGLMLPSEP